jgi:hypothetical protein
MEACDNQMELVVFAASLKFFFVEGGEQFIVGIQTAEKIGIKAILRITIAGCVCNYTIFLILLLACFNFN